MTYYDESGKILIDETAANKDIKVLSSINDSLQNAESLFDQIIGLASEFDQETGSGMIECCNLLRKQIGVASEENINAADFIKNTVQKYQLADGQMKNRIELLGGII